MKFIRYTPLHYDPLGGYSTGKRDSGICGANLVLGVEPLMYGRYGTEEGAVIYFVDGVQRQVADTTETILARLQEAAEPRARAADE